MKKIFSDYNCATFAEVLALLVDHKVPMHESLKLAAETTGDKKIIHSIIGMTNEIELGKPMHIMNEKHQISPYLWYLITHGYRESTFSDSLNNAAEMFRTRAIDRSEDLQKAFPIFTTILIGGTVVLMYGLCLFIPLIDLYKKAALLG